MCFTFFYYLCTTNLHKPVSFVLKLALFMPKKAIGEGKKREKTN